MQRRVGVGPNQILFKKHLNSSPWCPASTVGACGDSAPATLRSHHPLWCPASGAAPCGRRSRPCREDSSTFHGSQNTAHGSLVCNSFKINTCEPLASVDSKRHTGVLSLLDATLTKNRGEGVRPRPGGSRPLQEKRGAQHPDRIGTGAAPLQGQRPRTPPPAAGGLGLLQRIRGGDPNEWIAALAHEPLPRR
jgi:hypothetical protein